MDNKPVIISISTASTCLADPKFLAQFPEFGSIKQKSLAMRSIRSGCSSCAKRRAAKVIGSDFIRLVKALPENKLMKFKEYLGVSKVLINGMNSKTKRYESIIK